MTLKLFKFAAPVAALALLCGAAGCRHHESPPPPAPEVTPMAALDGYVWETSTPQSKLDFLLGVECAMAMEAAMEQAAREGGGRVELSLFANGWQVAFRDRSRPDIVRQIDEFYAQSPDQRGRHVFDVIWTEMIRPAMAEGR